MTAARDKVPKKNPLEWAVFAAGLLLSLGTMGFLAWESLSGAGAPPSLSVHLDTSNAARAAEGGYEVPVVVFNRGGTTAEAVRIDVLVGGVTAAEIEFDFVPHGSSREGVAFVTTDPATSALGARIVSFRRP